MEYHASMISFRVGLDVAVGNICSMALEKSPSSFNMSANRDERISGPTCVSGALSKES